jgi:hypothetical protein
MSEVLVKYLTLPGKTEPPLTIFEHSNDVLQVMLYLLRENVVEQPDLLKLGALLHDVGKIEQDFDGERWVHTPYTERYLAPLLADRAFRQLGANVGVDLTTIDTVSVQTELTESREFLSYACESHHAPACSPSKLRRAKSIILVAVADMIASALEKGYFGRMDSLLKASPYGQSVYNFVEALVHEDGLERLVNSLAREVHRIELPAQFVEDELLVNAAFLQLQLEIGKDKDIFVLVQRGQTVWVAGEKGRVESLLRRLSLSPVSLYELIYGKDIYNTILNRLPAVGATQIDSIKFVLVNEEIARQYATNLMLRRSARELIERHDISAEEINRIMTGRGLGAKLERQPEIATSLMEIVDTSWGLVRDRLVDEFGPLDLPMTLADQVRRVAYGEAKRDTLGLLDRADVAQFDKAQTQELRELLKLFDGKSNSYRSVTNVLLEYLKMQEDLATGEYDAPVADIALLDGQALVELKREENKTLCPICRRFPQATSAQAMITGNPKMDSVFQLYRGARSQIKICAYCFMSGYADLPLARITKEGQSINKRRDYLFVETPLAKASLERLLDYLREGSLGNIPEEGASTGSEGTVENDVDPADEIPYAALISELRKDGIELLHDLPILFQSRQRLHHVTGFLLNSLNALSNVVVLRIPIEELSGDEKVSGPAERELAKAVMFDFWLITGQTASLHYGSMPARETFTRRAEMKRPVAGRFTINGVEVESEEMRRASVAYRIAEYSPNPKAPPRFRQHLGRQATQRGAVLISPLYLLLLSDTRKAVNQMLRRHRRENDTAERRRNLIGEANIKEVLGMAESIAHPDWKFTLGLEIVEVLSELKLLTKDRGFRRGGGEAASGYELVKWLQRMKMIRDETSARAWGNQLINALKRGDVAYKKFRQQKGIEAHEPGEEVIGEIIKLTEKIIRTCEVHKCPLGEFSRSIAEMDYYLLFTYNQSQPKKESAA